MYIDQKSHIGYLWIDESSVKEELAVRSSAVPSVVASALGSDGAPVVNAGYGPALNHSASVEDNSVKFVLQVLIMHQDVFLRIILW